MDDDVTYTLELDLEDLFLLCAALNVMSADPLVFLYREKMAKTAGKIFEVLSDEDPSITSLKEQLDAWNEEAEEK